MNCKPGDLAIVVGGSVYAGLVCKVLYKAPTHTFELPNGVFHLAAPSEEMWVIEFPHDVLAPHSGKAIHTNRFGVGSDKGLRPIRDNDQQDEMIRIAGLPKELEIIG